MLWDSLTLEPAHHFTSPSPRPPPGLSRISVDKELVVTIVGDRVLTRKVESASGRGYYQKKPRHANIKTHRKQGTWQVCLNVVLTRIDLRCRTVRNAHRRVLQGTRLPTRGAYMATSVSRGPL